jgi:serine/threonine protein kinase
MSPEQIREPERIDARSDLYSLGITLYEALTGEVPFRGVPHMVLQQVLNDEPRPLRRLNDQVPRDLETICLHCLHKGRASAIPVPGPWPMTCAVSWPGSQSKPGRFMLGSEPSNGRDADRPWQPS